MNTHKFYFFSYVLWTRLTLFFLAYLDLTRNHPSLWSASQSNATPVVLVQLKIPLISTWQSKCHGNYPQMHHPRSILRDLWDMHVLSMVRNFVVSIDIFLHSVLHIRVIDTCVSFISSPFADDWHYTRISTRMIHADIAGQILWLSVTRTTVTTMLVINRRQYFLYLVSI